MQDYRMTRYKLLCCSIALAFSVGVCAKERSCSPPAPSSKHPVEKALPCNPPQGWSFDLGGQYTWMSFTSPPTFTGSTGGVQGKITYQEPQAFFGQLRSIYNLGSLSSAQTTSHDHEWYTEFVAGYCFRALSCWTITPYAGVGLDFLHDHKEGYSVVAPIGLNYRSYYALFGFDTHYTWDNWYLGLQADCLPVFHQYLSIGGLPGVAWKMDERVGVAVRLPAGCRLYRGIWLELAPYYRLLPIGDSSVLVMPERTLNQWGAFLTFRFFL